MGKAYNFHVVLFSMLYIRRLDYQIVLVENKCANYLIAITK
jgi:hypothetical protein